MAPYKTSITVKDYSGQFYGYNITIPAGSRVSNKTACGNDDAYHFWIDYSDTIEKITGYKNSILSHDVKHYGINVPAEFCQPY